MKNEKFTDFTERGLDLGRNWGWGKEIKAKEGVAWEIYEEFPPTGGLLLGDLILTQGASYLRPDLGTKDFARTLVKESFTAVDALEFKDGWDFYYLGLSYIYGRGTKQDFAAATEVFSASSCNGCPYAAFEMIWARHLSGGTRLDAVLDLTNLKGKLADFAAYSARALTLLELGPPRELGSSAHITRILLLHTTLHDFIYHDHGARKIRIEIEKEFRESVDGLKKLNTTRSNLALYLTAKFSRSNPTGREPAEWFSDTIDPKLIELELLCRRQELEVAELQMIIERAKSEGWDDAPLAKLALDELEDDY